MNKNKPVFTEVCYGTITPDMTLRDYFAAKAMQGMKASETEMVGYSVENLVKNAYIIADQMLLQRKK
ncbi:MAG: hypothetical protein PVI88_00045 [Nitrosopumilaceae archaeon]|jgi:hypothetical protein